MTQPRPLQEAGEICVSAGITHPTGCTVLPCQLHCIVPDTFEYHDCDGSGLSTTRLKEDQTVYPKMGARRRFARPQPQEVT